jgi:hypothetical protein
MRGVMKNELQFFYPFILLTVRLFILRFEINIIEADQEKFGSCPDRQLMRVLGCEQEKMTVAVFESVLIDAMGAIAINDIYQFEEVVFVGWFETLVCFFIKYFKRLMEVLRVHACKSTE